MTDTFNKLPLEKILKTALKNGGDFSEIFFESTIQTLITGDNNRIEKAFTGTDSGSGIRVIHGEKTAYGFTNDLSPKAMLDLAGTVAQAITGDGWSKNIDFTRAGTETIHKVKIRPDSAPLEQKAAIIKEANRAAWDFDKRIKQVSVHYKDSVRKISIANSLGEIADDEKIDTVFMVAIVAGDGTIIQTGYEPVGGFIGMELFDEIPVRQVIETASKRAITMLSARPAPSAKMPVILSSDAGGTMIHEAVGHGLEADLANHGFSVYQNCVGQQVASPLISVIDTGLHPKGRGTFSFDDEGVPAQKTILIKDGVLKTYMYNRLTAKKAGVQSTGNGRRESYRFRPSVRMTNTYIKPGSDDPQSILRDTDHGLFVKRMGGGQVNTITGDFVFEIQEGYLIKNGKTGEPVRGATLTGNGPDILKSIDRVGNDLGFAIGTCGKDGQGVPVGHAQPTLRIPELLIGGVRS